MARYHLVLAAAVLAAASGTGLAQSSLAYREARSSVLAAMAAAKPGFSYCAHVYVVDPAGNVQLSEASGNSGPCPTIAAAVRPAVVLRAQADGARFGSWYLGVEEFDANNARTGVFAVPGKIVRGVRQLGNDVGLAVIGEPQLGASLLISVGAAPAGAAQGGDAVIVFASSLAVNPLFPRALLDPGAVLGTATHSSGAGVPLQVPSDPSFTGLRFYAQAYFVMPAAVSPLLFTNAVEITVQ